MPHKAYRVETEVLAGGKIEVTLPIAEGSRVEVLVIAPDTDAFQGLTAAAASSLGFWDNPTDDAEWNDA